MLNIENEVTLWAVLDHTDMVQQRVGLYIRILVCEEQSFILD